MALSIGIRLGPYEILAPIGQGGMGEVYRARDTRLKRDVALKVLPPTFANDPDRMVRFQREADVLASLNHPNIAAIYGAEQDGNTRALAMEFVEGESPKGPLPFDDAWKICSQIAEALSYAHDKGVIHRDLKPANVKITSEGVVKLLDFGLAKAFTNQREASPAMTENSPTLTMGATDVGMILGTAAYMAPEQAKGRNLDKRADIWAFGVVLYELLAGQKPFKGDDFGEMLASVIKDQPALEKIPPQARPLIESCLEKDPKKRLRDIGDAGRLLESPMRQLAASSTPSRSRLGTLSWIAVVVLGVALALLGAIHFSERVQAERAVRFQLQLPGVTPSFEISPDGRYLAYVANQNGAARLWVRSMDSLEARALEGTEGAREYLFWSPDSKSIGFFSQEKMKRIAIAGGPPTTICDAPNNRGGTWNRDGIIIFAPLAAGPLYRVSANGGTPTPITKASDGESHRGPHFLPDGTHFTFISNAGAGAVYVGSLDGSSTGQVLPNVSDGYYARPATSEGRGHLFYRQNGVLMAREFDPSIFRPSGEPIVIAQDVPLMAASLNHGAYSASDEGTLVFREGNSTEQRQLVWFDRAGTRLSVATAPAPMPQAAGGELSPDGKRVAFAVGDLDRGADIWIEDLGSGSRSRLTFLPGLNWHPVWSPDGSTIAFHRGATGITELYQKRLDSKEELLGNLGINGYVEDWSSDSKWIAYQTTAPSTGIDLWLFPMEGDRKPVQYLATPAREANPRFSPDSRYIAYTSDESGYPEAYVQTVPISGKKWQISSNGGQYPFWRRDGKELYYASSDHKLMAVSVTQGPSLSFGKPQELFTFSADATNYEPTADGQRFLVNLPARIETTVRPLTLVLNWQAGLKK